jgi:hypothetical protein
MNRARLYGKKATQKQITDEIYSLITGNGSRPYPLSITDTARLLGVSRQTIYQHIKKMKGEKSIQISSGRLVIPKENPESKFFRFNSCNPIASDSLVSEWIDDLLTRKGGLPVVSWRTRLGSVESVCNTCKILPKRLIVSQKHTEMILRQYIKMYRQGNATRDNRGVKPPSDVTNVTYHKVQGVRDFCRYHGMVWPRGTTGIMSQKVPNHGKYSDIRLTDEELTKADYFIKEIFVIFVKCKHLLAFLGTTSITKRIFVKVDTCLYTLCQLLGTKRTEILILKIIKVGFPLETNFL